MLQVGKEKISMIFDFSFILVAATLADRRSSGEAWTAGCSSPKRGRCGAAAAARRGAGAAGRRARAHGWSNTRARSSR